MANTRLIPVQVDFRRDPPVLNITIATAPTLPAEQEVASVAPALDVTPSNPKNKREPKPPPLIPVETGSGHNFLLLPATRGESK
jgi:hypothetical protein